MKYACVYYHLSGLLTWCVRPPNAFDKVQRVVGQGFIETALASLLYERTTSLLGEQGISGNHLHVNAMATGAVVALINGPPGEVYRLGSATGCNSRQVPDGRHSCMYVSELSIPFSLESMHTAVRVETLAAIAHAYKFTW